MDKKPDPPEAQDKKNTIVVKDKTSEEIIEQEIE